MHFQELNRILRRRFYNRTRCRFHMSVGVRFGRVAMLEDRVPDLFLPIPLATRTELEILRLPDLTPIVVNLILGFFSICFGAPREVRIPATVTSWRAKVEHPRKFQLLL